MLLLLVVFALVFGIARLFGGDSEEDPAARARSAGAPVGDRAGSPAAEPTPVSSPDADPSAGPGEKSTKPSKPTKKVKVLAEPQGECDPADVVVTPSVEEAHVAEDVAVTLALSTRTSPACTFQVDPTSVIVAITSGPDPIWSSQECRRAIPSQLVVPRNNEAALVTMTWDGRRSDSDCSDTTDWAKTGWYHVAAVARGAVEPVDVQFELEPPVVRKPEPKKDSKKKNPAAR